MRAVDFLVRQGSIQVIDVTLSEPLPDWALPIDAGEAEVIILGQHRKADWVLIDNAHARRATHQAGLLPKGTVGVLLAAFRQGHLSFREFELLIENIKGRPELWISERLCNLALAQARRET